MAGTAAFSWEEEKILGQLRSELRRVAEWPADCPLSFALSLAPRTRGKPGRSW